MADVTSVDKSRCMSQVGDSKNQAHDDSDEDDTPRSPIGKQKVIRKGATLHRNADFMRSIEERFNQEDPDFTGRNVRTIKSMGSGRPLA